MHRGLAAERQSHLRTSHAASAPARCVSFLGASAAHPAAPSSSAHSMHLRRCCEREQPRRGGARGVWVRYVKRRVQKTFAHYHMSTDTHFLVHRALSLSTTRTRGTAGKDMWPPAPFLRQACAPHAGGHGGTCPTLWRGYIAVVRPPRGDAAAAASSRVERTCAHSDTGSAARGRDCCEHGTSDEHVPTQRRAAIMERATGQDQNVYHVKKSGRDGELRCGAS